MIEFRKKPIFQSFHSLIKLVPSYTVQAYFMGLIFADSIASFLPVVVYNSAWVISIRLDTSWLKLWKLQKLDPLKLPAFMVALT